MGEYASYRNEEIKIGTCENMYYLRYDQRFKVYALLGNVDPVRDRKELRFRFPWPDEDQIEPGSEAFHDNGYHRGIVVHGFTAPEIDHFTVQFHAKVGYLISLPCPESAEYIEQPNHNGLALKGVTRTESLRIHRNGFVGAVHLVAQRYIEGLGLAPILRCGGCGSMWREVERLRIEELVVCLRAEGDTFWHQIADRVLAGLEER